MGELKRTTGKYLGKQLTADTEKYKKYKCTFDMGEKDWNFTIFTPWTKKDGNAKKGVAPKDLEEGKLYDISYTEFQKEGMTWPAKTAVCFFDSKGERQQTIAESSNAQVKLDDATMDKMVEAYFELRKPEEQELNHFIGTIFRTLNPDMVKPLIKEFEIRKIKAGVKEE